MANAVVPTDFAKSAAYHVFRLGLPNGPAEVLHLDREDYRGAAFLDTRLAEGRRIGGWRVPLAELAAHFDAERAAQRPVSWLFHIGHCGSTLVSRLLDELPGVLGLREPLPLLELATLRRHRDGAVSELVRQWLPRAYRALGRGFSGTRRVVVKPTSVVLSLAEDVLALGAGDRAALLYIDLRSWLITMLRDPGLRADLRAQSSIRLAAPLPAALTEHDRGRLDDAELAALCWVADQARWQSLVADAEIGSRAMALDFQHLLDHPHAALQTLATHFDIDGDSADIDRALQSSWRERYAKDSAVEFNASVRQRELAAAAIRFAEEIERGIAFAEQLLRGGSMPMTETRRVPTMPKNS